MPDQTPQLVQLPSVTKHLVAEGILVLALLVLAGAWEKNRVDHLVQLTQISTEQKARQEAQSNFDGELAKRQQVWDKQDQQNQQRIETLQHMTPQQIVEKVPEYVALPPTARPITIFGPGVQPSVGDAIVPQEDVQAIAQVVLKGKNCTATDLPKCQADLADWKGKWALRDKDAKDWETLAKGGTFKQKLVRCSWLGGGVFGGGYAVQAAPQVGQPDSRLKKSAVLGLGTFTGCLFLR